LATPATVNPLAILEGDTGGIGRTSGRTSVKTPVSVVTDPHVWFADLVSAVARRAKILCEKIQHGRPEANIEPKCHGTGI
jgi:hypothetical protein